jgi:chromate transporter
MPPPPARSRLPAPPSLATIVREWGRIGCIGFGGPPAHIVLLRGLCVERRGWLSAARFERALAAVNILPGPASTQMAIYCAWSLRGWRGALAGGAGFILPGLALMLGLSALYLSGSPPDWVRGAAAGAGAAVAAVAVRAGIEVGLPMWQRMSGRRRRWGIAYALAGAAAAALAGPGLVLVLLACGLAELVREHPASAMLSLQLAAARPAVRAAPAGLGALAWTALKVGALAFGGGFVIVPLMQADAVSAYHWMTHAQFLGAVALGQVTPGPILQTVAAVGYAADGLPGGLLAAAVAFAPSFAFVLLGARRFERLAGNERVLAFLAGAAPATAGAILGAAIPLAGALGESWQYAILAAAAVLLLGLRRGIVPTLLLAGFAGAVCVLAGAAIPT